MRASPRLLLGVLFFSIAIAGISIASKRNNDIKESEKATVKAQADADRLRCHEVAEQIKGMRQEQLTLLARNRNDYNSPEVSEFLKKLRPLLHEYTALQLRHPEWEGKPQ